MLFHLIKESKKLNVASSKKDIAIKVIATAKSDSFFFMLYLVYCFSNAEYNTIFDLQII